MDGVGEGTGCVWVAGVVGGEIRRGWREDMGVRDLVDSIDLMGACGS